MTSDDARLDAVFSSMIVIAHSDEPIRDVVRRMRLNDIGAVVVVTRDNEDVVGIFSERDVVRAVADGADPASTPTSAYMTEGATTATPATPLREAARTMVGLGIRHLPVTSDAGLIGIVSLRDILIELIA